MVCLPHTVAPCAVSFCPPPPPLSARVVVMAMMVGTVFGALTCDGQAFNLSGFEKRRMESPGAYHAAGLNIIIPRTVYASVCVCVYVVCVRVDVTRVCVCVLM